MYNAHTLRTHICNRIETKAEFYQFKQYLIGIYMAKIPHSKLKISLEFAVFKGTILFTNMYLLACIIYLETNPNKIVFHILSFYGIVQFPVIIGVSETLQIFLHQQK